MSPSILTPEIERISPFQLSIWRHVVLTGEYNASHHAVMLAARAALVGSLLSNCLNAIALFATRHSAQIDRLRCRARSSVEIRRSACQVRVNRVLVAPGGERGFL